MVTTQFSMYSDQYTTDETRPLIWRYSYSFGVAATDLVITDLAWTNSDAGDARLVVDGSPVYGWQARSVWGSGTAVAATASALSLQHGIWVRRGASLSIECGYDGSVNEAWSIAGYTR